tara:strand:- start:58 stop:3564 length:3507 start_codon:yes stop_codon:yes gene_type:complete
MNTTSTNIKAIMTTSNVKSGKYFNKTMFYNIANKEKMKTLKKENKYISPLKEAIKSKKQGEYTIKYDEECGNKTYTKYGNFNYNELEKIGWKTNNHLFEIIDTKNPFKMYFDIDKRFISIDDDKKTLETLKELIKDTLKFDITEYMSVSYGKGTKDNYIKCSFHIVINNGFYFRNMDDAKKYFTNLNYLVITNDKYECLRNGILDFQPYKENQAFKLPYQTKAFKKIKQFPYNKKDTLKEFLITQLNTENIKYYNVEQFKDISDKKKVFKCANGQKVSFQFDEAIIIKEYISAIGVNYKLSKVKGNKKDGLSYYLDSIPNNSKVSRQLWKLIGYCISKITKNSEEGLEEWAKWTSNYKPTTKEELKEEYEKHNINRGYGWKTLYNIAKIYNKNMDNNSSLYEVLFDDMPTFESELLEINSRFIECEEFNMVENVKKYNIISIKSPMGTGKSYSLKQIFKDKQNYKSILYFSCKRAFSCAMASDFEEFGFKNYLEIEDKSKLTNYNRVICSVESIQYVREKYDLIIIDESETITNNLMGKMFIKNNPIEGANKIKQLVSYSKRILLMDAYLSKRSFDFLKDIIGEEEIKEKKCLYLKNNFKYEQRTYIDTDNKGIFTKRIIDTLKTGKRCVVVCGSYTLCQKIKEEATKGNFDILCYDSKNPLPLKFNVNEGWKKCQLLIYTPTITAGISYNNPLYKFDNLFIYSVNKGSCMFRDTIQAHKRIREFTDKNIYICLNDKFKGFESKNMPLTFKGVEEIEYKFKKSLFGDEEKTVENFPWLKFLYNINIYNIVESNISQLCLRGLAQRYLKEENIIKKHNEQEEEILLNNIETWKYEDIREIEHFEKETIKAKIEDTSINKIQVEEDEIKEYVKYNYDKEHTKADISKHNKQEFFNYHYGEQRERQKLGSVRGFKQMLNEIQFDFTKYANFRNEKLNSGDTPFEFMDLKFKRWEHLLKFFQKLGFIENNKINIDNKFYGIDFDKLKGDYEELTPIHINTMLKEGYLKASKTPFKNSKQIKGIFNQLLKEEFGMEIGTEEKPKYKVIDGKKKKLSVMYLMNQAKKINNDDEETEKFKSEYNEKMTKPQFNKFNMYKDNFANDGEEVDNERENAESEESDNNEEEIVIQSNEEISEMSFFTRREKKGTQNVRSGDCKKCGRKSFLPICSKCLQ